MMSGVAHVMGTNPTASFFFSSGAFASAIASIAPNGIIDEIAA
jgi:hypothetical protein